MEIWKVKFAYSGKHQREFFEKEFEVMDWQRIEEIISSYVKRQNWGEAKSDKIRFWSKKQIVK